MKIDVIDSRRGVIKIRVECEDDLWLLSMLISPGDLVKALTFRDVSLGYEKQRLPMVLTIRVLKTEFQPFTNRLRVHGVVVEGPDRFGVKGSHHTINVDVGSEVTIYKQNWNPRVLDELLRLVRPIKALLIAIDFDEYTVALLQSQGIKVLDDRSISLPVSDRTDFEYYRDRVVKELAKRIVDIASRTGTDIVVIASPGELKNYLRREVQELNPKLRVYTDTVANGGYAGIQELLNRDIVRKILSDLAVAEASRILEEFDRYLVKDTNRVVYGLDRARIAAELGVVEKMVIIDEILFTYDNIKLIVEKMLRDVVDRNGRVVIVPTDSPPGQRVKVLGGVVAILRYSVDIESISKEGYGH